LTKNDKLFKELYVVTTSTFVVRLIVEWTKIDLIWMLPTVIWLNNNCIAAVWNRSVMYGSHFRLLFADDENLNVCKLFMQIREELTRRMMAAMRSLCI
jgi:hypothetical protein